MVVNQRKNAIYRTREKKGKKNEDPQLYACSSRKQLSMSINQLAKHEIKVIKLG